MSPTLASGKFTIVEVVSIPERLGKTKARDRAVEATNLQVAARCGVRL
jgi:hypothetical protein